MRHLTALAILALSALALTEAAVYIGGGCYDCKLIPLFLKRVVVRGKSFPGVKKYSTLNIN